MRAVEIAAFAAVVVAYSGAARADEALTVQSLLQKNFAVVGAITSSVGPGLFLQNKDQLFVCFVSETPTSATVTTRYCKPVH